MFKDRAILLLALGETLIWAAFLYLFPASLVRWEADLGWSKADLTLAITIALFASAFAAPFAGRAIDRGHGPTQMGLAAVIGGVALIGVSQITTLWQFYILWLVIGVCMAGTLYEPCFAMVTRARGATAKQGIILITLAAGFAGTVSFPTVHFLSEAFGWRAATAIIGGVVIIFVAPVLWSGAKGLGNLAAPPSTRKPPASSSYLHNPVYWLLGTGFALSALTHGATLHHILPLLEERGLAPQLAVFAASCIGPMQVVGRLGMVATQRRFSHHIFALIAFTFIGSSVAVLLAAGASLVLIGAFVVLFGSAYGTVSILRPVIARDLLGEENFGAKSGGLALLYLAASASSAYLGALLWGIGGYTLMLWILIAFAAMGAVLYTAAHHLAKSRV